MITRRESLSGEEGQRASIQRDQDKRPRCIKKEGPRRVRSPARLIQESEDRETEQASPSPPAGKVPNGRLAPPPPETLHEPSKLHQKRERGQEAQVSPQVQDPPSKRPRTSPLRGTAEEEPQKRAESDTSKNNPDPVETWIQTKRWPSEYFKQDSQVREDFEHDSWLEEQMAEPIPVVQYVEINGLRYPRPIRKLPSSLRRKQSGSSLTGSSDQKRRESKSAHYGDARYTTLLATKGSYMHESELGITKESQDLCQCLLESEQAVPKDSLFRDDLFQKTLQMIKDRNEARIVQNVSRLIVPSAETLAVYGATNLAHLLEGVNEGWTGGIPVEGPRPQPDYSVGFKRSAFTDEQLKRLSPLIGTVFDTSFFVATYRMYFPFFTCEVKCGAVALDTADRQNAHSMTIAVRGIVELYKAVKREKELHREILAFSISHNDHEVRIYGHYPVIDGNKTTCYRHLIHTSIFATPDGKEKWRAYQFAKNVYDIWMPIHRKRICSVIDQLPPNVDFNVDQGSELQFSEAAGLSQELGNLLSEPSNVESALGVSQDDSELVPSIPHTDTPDTPETSDTSLAQGKIKQHSNDQRGSMLQNSRVKCSGHRIG